MFLCGGMWAAIPIPACPSRRMYEPPKGISPAEAGTLLDDTIHPRDITSTIVDLAVRGFIKIEEVEDEGPSSSSPQGLHFSHC
jgi:hypothetical protein